MARLVRLDAIRTEIVNQGGYKNSPVFTTAVLNAWISRAIAKVYDFVWQSGEDYYTAETTLPTVAASDSIALPADFLKLIGASRLDGTTYRRLRRLEIHRWSEFEGSSGKPHWYRLQGAAMRLSPVPDAIYTIKLLYTPVAPTLTVDADTFDSIDYFDELVIAEVLLKCAGRDERQFADMRQTIAGLEQSIKRRANARDAAEPIYLADLGDCDDDGDFY